MTFSISFAHSYSPHFPFLLKEAQGHHSFCQDDKLYYLIIPLKEGNTLFRIATMLKRFRNKHVLVDGKSFSWDEVFCFLNCYTLRDKSYDCLRFCHGDSKQFPALNIWGCINALMPLSAQAEWLCYGHFDSDGTFIFDKEKIKHYFLSNTKAYRFCPALDETKMIKTLEAFPETANPRIDKDWVSVKTIDYSLKTVISSCPDKDEFIGVAPSSHKAAENIYAKIMAKIS